MKNNIKIRQEMKKANVKGWQLAEMLAVTEWTLSRWLRKELPKEEQDRIIKIIKERMD